MKLLRWALVSLSDSSSLYKTGLHKSPLIESSSSVEA